MVEKFPFEVKHEIVGDFKDLAVYQKAYKLAMDIMEVSKKFPPEEKFSLTGQIRRSSRSVVLILRRVIAKEDIRRILF